MLNKVLIQGNVTRDPEVRTTSNDNKIVKFGLAWNETRNGEETAHFYNVVVMGRTADFVEQYVKKGSGVIVEGQLNNNRWTDKESGDKRSAHEIFVGFTGSVNFSGSKRKEGEEGGESAPAAAGAAGEGQSGDSNYF
jgi:single-strand DNA-binding protein